MRRRWLVAVGLLIVGLALVARLVPGPRTIDDAFITYRYARNLLLGRGLVFNPGERVLGTTTPLYALLLAALALPFGSAGAPFPLIALGFNAVLDAASCLVLMRIGRQLGHEKVGLLAAGLWSIAPFSVTFAVGGLETSVFILLLLLTYSLYLEGKLELVGLTAGLAALTRPDALLLVVLIGIDAVLRAWGREGSPMARRRFWVGAGMAALVLLPWLVFAHVYYGSILAGSIPAKRVAYHLAPQAGLVRLVQAYGTPFLEDLSLGTAWVAVGFVGYLFLSLWGIRAAALGLPRAWPGLVYPWLFFLVFALANPLIFRWYLAETLPFYILSILLGASLVLSDLRMRRAGKRALRLPRWVGRAGTALLVCLPVATTARGWQLHPPDGPGRPAPAMASVRLEEVYTQVADFLRPQLGAGERVAAGDVGSLGYALDVPILDTVGLVSPEARAYYPLPDSFYVINYAIPPELILEARPRFVVLLEVYGRNGLLRDARFLSEYELLRTFDTDMYGSRGMLVFRRKG